MEDDTCKAPATLLRQTEYQALATFVASLDHQLATTKAAQPEPRQELRFAVALVSGLTLFALAIHGFHPYAEDGGLYLAGVKRLLNPALYPHSTAFVLEPTRFSLFAPAVAALVRGSHLALPEALLALHLASIWITLFAAWMLASRCWSARPARAGAVVLLACWLSLPVAGTALVLMDPYLTARSISTPCMVLALVGVLDSTNLNRSTTTHRSQHRGLLLWIASIALAAAMHPLMAAYAFGGTLILACMRSRSQRIQLWATAAFSFAALTTAACIQAAAKPESADYPRIALTRTYWFPAQWSWYELIGLAAPLVILAIYAWLRPSSTTDEDSVTFNGASRSLARTAIAAGTTAWLAASLLVHPTSLTYLIARLQPLRIFQIVYLVMVLVLGAKLGESVLRRRLWRWAVAMFLLGGIMFTAAQSAFPNSRHIELPWTSPHNPWVQAFVWIRQSTPNDALFALDSDYINSSGEDAQCFRAIAERSALPDYSKDGGEAAIAPELAPAWKAGQQAQRGLSAAATTDAMRIASLSPLAVSWIVLDAHTATSFDCPFANTAVKVCRLR